MPVCALMFVLLFVCLCISAVHFCNPTDLKSSVNAGSTGTERERERKSKREDDYDL